MQLLSRIQRCTAQQPKPVVTSRGDSKHVEMSVLRKRMGMTALSFRDIFLKES